MGQKKSFPKQKLFYLETLWTRVACGGFTPGAARRRATHIARVANKVEAL